MRTPATRASWKTIELPAAHVTLPIDRRFTADEMELIRPGLIPEAMEQHWFMFYENDRLFLHRSWTGYCIFVAHFQAKDDGAILTHAEANRDPRQYGQTQEAEDVYQINNLIDGLMMYNRRRR